jgi:hypothetical protein
MASPNSTFTEMVTTTLRHHVTKVTDNNSKNNALLNRLKKRGKIETVSGGYELVFPLDYGGNSTYQRFDGYDPLNVGASDVLSASKYDWAQVAIHVTASGKEIRMNSGKEAMIKLVKERVNSAMRTAANNFSTDIYGTGALTNQIGGLGHLITTDGTGTVGGIVAGTYTWWKNKFKEMTGTGTYASIQADMNSLWLSTVRGGDKPDLLVSTHDLYAAFEATLQTNQRYTESSMAALGFEALKYKSADLIFDDNTDNFTTTGEKMYFINTEYLKLIQHSDAQWTQDDQKVPTNQDAVIIPIYWMGQLVCTNRSLQGVMFDAA